MLYVVTACGARRILKKGRDPSGNVVHCHCVCHSTDFKKRRVSLLRAVDDWCKVWYGSIDSLYRSAMVLPSADLILQYIFVDRKMDAFISMLWTIKLNMAV